DLAFDDILDQNRRSGAAQFIDHDSQPVQGFEIAAAALALVRPALFLSRQTRFLKRLLVQIAVPHVEGFLKVGVLKKQGRCLRQT
ncbi:MAG: hypothetical protein JNK68_06240, partial [Betaproteobacteria bacterium]|nr:hypothetical protein [Betaproteobacteria bacterium]